MKKLSKINLHNLSQVELSKREENLLRGGLSACYCMCSTTCGCLYEGEKEDEYDAYYGGSSSDDNGKSNAGKLHSSSTSSTNDYIGEI